MLFLTVALLTLAGGCIFDTILRWHPKITRILWFILSQQD